MIGDGMGLTQVSALHYQNGNRSAFEYFNSIGFHKSYSSSDLITDSAAGATAFSCGIKTYNNAIGMDQDTMPCETILELAEKKGYATGLVATSSIVHATPAAFAAHQPMRVYNEEIAEDMADAGIDLLIGGGKKFFDRRKKDDRELSDEMVDKGYFVTDYFRSELRNFKQLNPNQPFLFFTSDSKPISAFQGRDYLPIATSLAVNYLPKRSEEGFFLMIEGSQIDWECHANKAKPMLDELEDFEKALYKVLEFAAENKETLVIVTGDHETGGLAIQEGSKMKKLDLAFTTNGHTASMVPVYAFGPQAERFRGIYENTAIYHKMLAALGWEDGSINQ